MENRDAVRQNLLQISQLTKTINDHAKELFDQLEINQEIINFNREIYTLSDQLINQVIYLEELLESRTRILKDINDLYHLECIICGSIGIPCKLGLPCQNTCGRSLIVCDTCCRTGFLKLDKPPHERPRTISCPICQKESNHKKYFVQDNIIYLVDNYLEKEGINIADLFNCDICNGGFSTMRQLLNHRRLHQRGPIY